eukprot:1139076-Pelagomonas_calceolata.AAC.3
MVQGWDGIKGCDRQGLTTAGKNCCGQKRTEKSCKRPLKTEEGCKGADKGQGLTWADKGKKCCKGFLRADKGEGLQRADKGCQGLRATMG